MQFLLVKLRFGALKWHNQIENYDAQNRVTDSEIWFYFFPVTNLVYNLVFFLKICLELLTRIFLCYLLERFSEIYSFWLTYSESYFSINYKLSYFFRLSFCRTQLAKIFLCSHVLKVACVLKMKLFFYGLFLLSFDNTN